MMNISTEVIDLVSSPTNVDLTTAPGQAPSPVTARPASPQATRDERSAPAPGGGDQTIH
jgi:hypothetical protein